MNDFSSIGEMPLLLLAQDSPPVQPPLGGAGGGMTTSTGAPVAADEAAAAPPVQPFGGDMFIWIFVILFLFIGLSFLSGRKEKKRRKEMLASLGKKASVQTIGGIVGTVAEVQGDQVTLIVDKSTNTRMTFTRAAIQQVLEPGEEAAAE